MFKKKEVLAFVAVAIVLLSGVGAYANQIPNRDELKAAYCIADTRRTGLAAEEGLKIEGTSHLQKELIILRDNARTDLARLVAFLKPRTKYLDGDSLRAAVERGLADSKQYVWDRISCRTACLNNAVNDAECWRKSCGEDSAAGFRLATCNDLSFLPF